jgi:cytochrome c-type biogenesis protein CcmH/NrfG
LKLERRAYELDPSNPDCLDRLARWLANSPNIEERDPKEGFELSERAVALKPEVPTYRNTLALVNIRLGNWDRASEQIAQLRRSRSNNWYDAVLGAIVELHYGDRESAEQLLASSGSPSDKVPPFPDSPEAQRLLADLRLLLSQQ